MSIENMNHKSSNPKYSKLHIKIPDAVVVTYSWSAISQGICGHNFEAYEYLWNLINKNINAKNVKYLIPDSDDVAGNIQEALKSKYNNYEAIKDYIINGKPEVLTARTVVLCDGQLPTKGTIDAQKLVLILCAREPKWTNISSFTGTYLELWYDGRVDYSVTGMIHVIHQIRPDIQITIRSNYIKRLDFSIYKAPRIPIYQRYYKYLVYVTGNCRDMFLADQKYKSDTLKEIKETLIKDKAEYPIQELMIIGWNPTYSMEEKLYFNNHKDQKIFEDRKRASVSASDLTDYFDCEVTIVPECDLPLDNILEEFDTYIYTPTEKNWDCSSRLISECKQFGKRVVLTDTAKRLLTTPTEGYPQGNTALKIRLEDTFPELLR